MWSRTDLPELPIAGRNRRTGRRSFVPVRPRTIGSDNGYRAMMWRLRQFEGRRCLWRVGWSALIVIGIPAMPVLAISANTYIAGRAAWPVVAAVGIAVAALTAMAGKLWGRKPWVTGVANRLWTYESDERRPWAVRVLVRPEDDIAAATALRRAKFNPCSFVRIPGPPPDAPDLLTQIQVIRPSAWHEPASDQQQLDDVAAVFRAARIRARVASLDIFP